MQRKVEMTDTPKMAMSGMFVTQNYTSKKVIFIEIINVLMSELAAPFFFAKTS